MLNETIRGKRLLLAAAAGAMTVALGATACSGSSTDTAATPETSVTASQESAVGSANAPQSVQTKLVTLASNQPFDATIDALKQAVSSNGMMVLGDLDQAGALQTTGLQLKGAHSFFVGNPAAGKMFFEKTPAIGTVIPLRMFVWADNDGKTSISYFDPKPLFEAVDPGLADGGQKMSDAAAMIAKAATGGQGQSQSGSAQNATLVTVDAKGSFEDTMNAVKQAVSSNGMMVLGDLDQASALQTTGLQLKGAHSFFVGNPAAGKMFFEKTPAIGTVIPVRLLVWADNDGKSHVSYFDPAPLFTAVDPQLADGGKKMSDAMTMITNAVK